VNGRAAGVRPLISICEEERKKNTEGWRGDVASRVIAPLPIGGSRAMACVMVARRRKKADLFISIRFSGENVPRQRYDEQKRQAFWCRRRRR